MRRSGSQRRLRFDTLVDFGLPVIFGFVNRVKREELSPELQALQDSLVQGLEVVLGERSGRLFPNYPNGFELPIGFRIDKNNRVQWFPKSKSFAPFMNLPEEKTLRALVALLYTDPDRRRLLRRCDECRRFFMAKGNFDRPHHFCDERCRRRFDLKHRDREKQRDYMRAYRQRKKAAKGGTDGKKR